MADNRYLAAYQASLEDVEAAERVVAEKKKVSNMLAPLAGVETPFDSVDAPAATALGAIKIDQFTSMGAPSVAARAYLEMRGKEKGAATFEQIFEALQRGGYVFGKGDAKAGLKIAMGKDEKLLKLPNDAYGLREWYGGAKKLDKPKKGAPEDPAEDEPETQPDQTPDPPASEEVKPT
jgi:hypothetical protein